MELICCVLLRCDFDCGSKAGRSRGGRLETCLALLAGTHRGEGEGKRGLARAAEGGEWEPWSLAQGAGELRGPGRHPPPASAELGATPGVSLTSPLCLLAAARKTSG